ncbi:MAG: tetratricopeptide repeat protein [bacterium]|nr:tetratricopeptide repeat protein [bacterium]
MNKLNQLLKSIMIKIPVIKPDRTIVRFHNKNHLSSHISTIKNALITHQTALQILAICLLVLICYFNIITTPFLWDDEVMIVANPMIKSFKNIIYIFTSSAFGQKASIGKFYRPVQIISYIIDYKLWKLNPVGYHLTNILIHTLNSLLIFYLLVKINIRKNLAFIIAVIFAVHPVHIESVTYISGRGDALFLLFSLICFIFFIWGKTKKWYYPLSLITFILAFISKENAVTIPVIIAAYVFIYKKQSKQDLLQIIWLLLINTVMIAFAGIRVLPAIGKSTTLSMIASAPLWSRIATVPHILFKYFSLLLFPFNLHMEYHFYQESLLNPYLLLGVPLILVISALIMKYLKSSGTFWLLWFFIALGPVYNVILPLASTIREHWLYLPSTGFIALCCIIIDKVLKIILKNRKQKTIILISVAVPLFFVIYFSTCTIIRNIDWKTPVALYEHDLKYEPNSFLLHNNVGVEYFRMGKFKKAKEAFSNSIAASPGGGYSTAYNNLGVILEQEGNVEMAINHFRYSIERGQYELAYINLCRILLRQNKHTEAIDIMEKGAMIHPRNPKILYLLGFSYYINKDFESALKTFKLLDRIHPDYNEIRKNFLNTKDPAKKSAS